MNVTGPDASVISDTYLNVAASCYLCTEVLGWSSMGTNEWASVAQHVCVEQQPQCLFAVCPLQHQVQMEFMDPGEHLY